MRMRTRSTSWAVNVQTDDGLWHYAGEVVERGVLNDARQIEFVYDAITAGGGRTRHKSRAAAQRVLARLYEKSVAP